jgi:hypothetical protein
MSATIAHDEAHARDEVREQRMTSDEGTHHGSPISNVLAVYPDEEQPEVSDAEQHANYLNLGLLQAGAGPASSSPNRR